MESKYFDLMEMASAATGLEFADKSVGNIGKLIQFLRRKVYPKPKYGNTGLVFAIRTENSTVEAQVKNDFYNPIQTQIRGLTGSGLEAIWLPAHHADNILDQEEAGRVLQKCKSKVIVWGLARVRSMNGKPSVVLDLHAVAQHAEILTQWSEIFTRDMRELVPNRSQINRSNSLIEFENTAEGQGLVARYVAAVALYLSKDRDAALKIFSGLKVDLNRMRIIPKELKDLVGKLKIKVDASLVTLRNQASTDAFYRWRKTRDVKHLTVMMEQIGYSEAIVPRQYDTAMKRSIYQVEVEGDVDKALLNLSAWKSSVTDGTWAANMAYLYLCKGDLRSAQSSYMKSFRLGMESSTVLELLEFIEWKLGETPRKNELNFGLGMIEYFCRNENDSANSYFEEFVRSTPPHAYQEQISFAKGVIEDICEGRHQVSPLGRASLGTKRPQIKSDEGAKNVKPSGRRKSRKHRNR